MVRAKVCEGSLEERSETYFLTYLLHCDGRGTAAVIYPTSFSLNRLYWIFSNSNPQPQPKR